MSPDDLRAKIDTLYAERDELQSSIDLAHKYGVNTEPMRLLADSLGMREGKHTANSVADAAREAIGELRAEVARLRAAIQEQADRGHHYDCECTYGPCTCIVGWAEDLLRPPTPQEGGPK